MVGPRPRGSAAQANGILISCCARFLTMSSGTDGAIPTFVVEFFSRTHKDLDNSSPNGCRNRPVDGTTRKSCDILSIREICATGRITGRTDFGGAISILRANRCVAPGQHPQQTWP